MVLCVGSEAINGQCVSEEPSVIFNMFSGLKFMVFRLPFSCLNQESRWRVLIHGGFRVVAVIAAFGLTLR